MAEQRNSRRVIVDGGIGVGKSTLLRQYVAAFNQEHVSFGEFPSSRVIRLPDEPPILVLLEPIKRWTEKCQAFYAEQNSNNNNAAALLFELQLEIILALFDRELHVLRFLVENPTARVIQERGISSVGYFLEANREIFGEQPFGFLSDLAGLVERLELGSNRILLTMPEEQDRLLLSRVHGRGDVIPQSYLSKIADMYRKAAKEYDMVMDPLEEDCKMNLAAFVERLE